MFTTNVCINPHMYIMYSTITTQSAIASTYIMFTLTLYILYLK